MEERRSEKAVGVPVYASDPGSAPDSAFEPGTYRHLVVGREGRLLDPRRTPVSIVGLDLRRGYFEVEVRAFEDAGARWLVPVESVSGYQFGPGPEAAAGILAAIEDAARRFDRPLQVPADLAALEATRQRLTHERAAAAAWLEGQGVAGLDLSASVHSREGDPRLCTLLERYLDQEGLGELDAGFATTFVSNPRSGERVKGHAVVLAELGLCAFTGSVVRDEELFQGAWSKEARTRHLLRRMGFVQALFARAAPATLPVYRGLHFDGAPRPPAPASFVSASFSRDVAMSNFLAGPPSSSGILLRQPLPVDRLFMTFIETRAMGSPFREAEAVLIGATGTQPF